jgi:thiol-disulfide isomerase/thioredoxin
MSSWGKLAVLGGLFTLNLAGAVSAQVTPQQILAIKPAQKDVEIETPPADQVDKCKIDISEDRRAWVLLGPQGQVLRRFVDTKGDGRVDRFSYYLHGLEVYRDYDTDGNDKINESRWMHTAGSRWGIDRNEDGKIDEWKRISAEEASREAVKALIAADPQALSTVLATADDLKKAGIRAEISRQILERTANAPQKLTQNRAAAKSLTPQSQWARFDSSMLMPNLIPAEAGKSANDLLVYENVMAIVETAGQNSFIQIGEMVLVGDAWKLTQIPAPVEGDRLEAEAGLLLQQTLDAAGMAATGVSPKVQELIKKLQDLDTAAPQAGAPAAAITKYNVDRAALLGELAAAADTSDDRSTWLRHQIEWIATATQMASYPNGTQELQRFEKLLEAGDDQDLLAFVVFQRLLADYNVALQKAEANDRQKVQDDWLKSLEAFARRFPQASNAPEALLQLATTHEFNGNGTEAQRWYQTIIANYAASPSANRARGALRRLTLKGQRIQLAGNALAGGALDLRSYQGKVVAVVFWATWCKPCTEDLPLLQELYRTHRPQGFEVVGVNLDVEGAPIQQYIQQYKVAWPHIHEPGALESRPAVEFGIISLPTIFLVDQKGVVVSANSSIEELKKLVPELVKAK